MLCSWYFLHWWSRQVLALLKFRLWLLRLWSRNGLSLPFFTSRTTVGSGQQTFHLKSVVIRRVSWSYVPWDSKRPSSLGRVSLHYPLYLQNYCERRSNSCHLTEVTAGFGCRCLSTRERSRLWNASVFKCAAAFPAGCLNGHPEILGITHFHQPSETFPCPLCASPEHFQMCDSGTQVSHLDDVA